MIERERSEAAVAAVRAESAQRRERDSRRRFHRHAALIAAVPALALTGLALQPDDGSRFSQPPQVAKVRPCLTLAQEQDRLSRLEHRYQWLEREAHRYLRHLVTCNSYGLSPDQVAAEMNEIKPRATRCLARPELSGFANIELTIENDGHVSNATVIDKFAGTPIAPCIEAAVRTAVFPGSLERVKTSHGFMLTIDSPADCFDLGPL